MTNSPPCPFLSSDLYLSTFLRWRRRCSPRFLDTTPNKPIRSKQPAIEGFGTLMQQFQADNYRGKKLRFSAMVKTETVKAPSYEWAGLWMRIDIPGKHSILDNMHDRPIKGTKDWKRCEVTLAVPDDAAIIAFGVLLEGTGEVWISDVKLEVLNGDTPGPTPDNTTPQNLGFSN